MKISKYKFGFRNGKFITIRKWNFWYWIFGYNREYCSYCDSIEYHEDQMSIVGSICTRCGSNPVMEELLNDAKKA